jgi:mRNA interferase MazF
MTTGLKLSRGDVVLLPIAFVSGVGTKVRPAVVIQEDSLNRRLNSTIVAIITSTNRRAQHEATQLFVDIGTSEGQQTGLVHNSTVKAEHLDTVDQRDVVRIIGRFSDPLLKQLENCIKAALRLS